MVTLSSPQGWSITTLHLSTGWVDGIHQFPVHFCIDHHHYVVQKIKNPPVDPKTDNTVITACPTPDGGAMVVVELGSGLLATGLLASKICASAAKTLGGSYVYSERTPWIAHSYGPRWDSILDVLEDIEDDLRIYIGNLPMPSP